VVVPQGTAPAPVATAASGPRLAKAAYSSQAAAPTQTQTRFTPGRLPGRVAAPPKKAWVKWATVAGVVIAVGVGAIYGIPYILDLQDKANAKRREAAKNSDGGEVGHTMELYKVLDATEPGGRGLGGMNTTRGHGPAMREGQMEFPVASARSDGSAPVPNMPVVAPVWTLEPLPSAIPEGRANGMLSGTNFLVENVRIDTVGTAQVLRLLQGAAASPDREVLIYLHLKPGETLSGHTWAVTKDMTGSAAPQVTKRWKTDPKHAPQLKSYLNGYALKLEMGQLTNGLVSGKIFLALPDPEKSVVAGYFNGAIIAPGTAAPMATTPMSPKPNAASAEFDRRYGKAR